eukprot:Blabericola_migrator_1__13479@NODE_977_length_5837_cov_124_372097_g677_i0_p1_GENE_NODE_977_length_5837_cov_124_372097_g677_i0NODE_977_length_5837_cov_124_372097_g677_i0_p1_ORF_typecomplete_len1124_score153_36Anoctamin/PF04547_12/1_8e73_NODE_977_length_5837_cov_124_372097_g677_i012904661
MHRSDSLVMPKVAVADPVPPIVNSPPSPRSVNLSPFETSVEATPNRGNAFLDKLKRVRTNFTPSLALLSATSDRIRVSSPRNRQGDQEDEDDARVGHRKSDQEKSVNRFKERVKKEGELTEKNGYFQEGQQRYSIFPEEYYDYCYVFHTHPADFGEEVLLPQHHTATTTASTTSSTSGDHDVMASATRFAAESEPFIPGSHQNKAAREALFKNLRSQTLTKDEIRYYLAHVCSYRDKDTVVSVADAQRNSDLPSYFSSFSLAVHHTVQSGKSILEDQAFREMLGKIFRRRRAETLSRSSAEGSGDSGGIELSTTFPTLIDDASRQPPSEPVATSGYMSPPLAAIRDTSGREHFVSAGASTLPPFYGLHDFLGLLEAAHDKFVMTMLDFSLLVREMFTSGLKKAGADITEFMSSDNTQLMVKVRLREKPCRRIANHIEYNCQCCVPATGIPSFLTDPEYIPPYLSFDEQAENLQSGWYAARCLRPVWKRYDGLSREIKFSAKNLLLAQEEQVDVPEEDRPNFINVDDVFEDYKYLSLFRDTDRIRLLQYVVQEHFDLQAMSTTFSCKDTKFKTSALSNASAAEIGITHVITRSKKRIPPIILSHFPLHKRHVQAQFCGDWASFKRMWSTSQPLDRIRDYYGEQVAFYFLWTGYFTDCLKVPSLIGLIVFVLQHYLNTTGRFDTPLMAFLTGAFAIYMSVWSSMFAIKWRVHEKYWRLRWGMTSERPLEKVERSSFLYDYLKEDEIKPRRFSKFYHPRKSQLRSACSAAVTLFSVGAIVGCVVGIYSLRVIFKYLPEDFVWLKNRESAFISSVQALQIVLFDYLWCAQVRWQTNLENHRFEKDHQRSIVAKMFLFRFMNNFYALLYIAFARNYVEPCASFEEGGCIYYFQLQLAVLYLLFFAFNVVELGLPLTSFWFKQTKLNHGDAHEFVEIQSLLAAYDESMLVEDYMEIVIQYCTVVFFSVAFPLAPLFSYVQNLLEIRVDAYKLAVIQRRAYPASAPEGLSTYNDIVQLIGLTAAPLNVALCIFLIPFGATVLPLGRKLLYFILAEHFLVLVRTYIQFNSVSTDEKLERLNEKMRVACHEIMWGNPNEPSYEKRGAGVSVIATRGRRVDMHKLTIPTFDER